MFKRLGNLIRGFFARMIGDAERANPEALLALEKENLREQIARANQGLAAHAAHVEKLLAQVARQERQVGETRTRVTSHLRAGNKGVAAQHALHLQETEAELADNRRQLEDARTTYRQMTRARDASVEAARKKIESLRHDLDDLKVKQATAEVNEMAAGMIAEIGGAGDSLARLEEMVIEERDLAAGRARVAQDAQSAAAPPPGPEVDAKSRQALADQALAAFAAAEGIALDGPLTPPPQTEADEPPATSTDERRMGPLSETE